MGAREIRRDPVREKECPSANAITDSAPRSAEPHYEVVPDVHATGDGPVESVPSQGQKRACERNPISGKRIVFFPPAKMLRPRHADWKEFIHDSLTLQKTRENAITQDENTRFRKPLP